MGIFYHFQAPTSRKSKNIFVCFNQLLVSQAVFSDSLGPTLAILPPLNKIDIRAV